MTSIVARMVARIAVRRAAWAAVLIGLAGVGVRSEAQTRALSQDPSLNNLVHPPGYHPAPLGTLGVVLKVGTGPKRMILIPGLGFGGEVFDEFMARRSAQYTMYAVTLAGVGGTPAPPMPEGNQSFGETPWTRSAIDAIRALMDREGIGRATLVAHWALGTQIALRLALDFPNRFDAVVLIGGVAKAYYGSTPAMLNWTLSQRAAYSDQMAQRWFKTVTRRTWDDQNFMSYDYAVNPLRALFLWRAAAEPSLPVWIRYLLEFYAVDPTTELERLRVPTLVVRPGFDDPGVFIDSGRTYMTDLLQESWRGVEGRAPAIEFVTVPGARLFVWYDQPTALDQAVDRFLAAEAGGPK